jgi:hypothetical protein
MSCFQVICNDKGRGHGHYPSWGKRRKRQADNNEQENLPEEQSSRMMAEESIAVAEKDDPPSPLVPEEEVHELLRVYMSRDEVPPESKQEQSVSSERKMPLSTEQTAPSSDRVCVSQSAYYALLSAVTVLVTVIVLVGVAGSRILRSFNNRSKHLVY